MAKAKSNWSAVHEAFPILGCIPPWIAWQRKARDQEQLSREVNAGINYSIILAAACYIEGSLEYYLLRSVPTAGNLASALEKRLLENLHSTISATTGSEGYDRLFELVKGEKASTILADPELWEAVKVLFHFRNVLAHGRAVGYRLRFPPGVGGVWEEEFSGGYKKVEDFLTKKKLLKGRHIEEADNWFYFTNEIADFFWSQAEEFVRRLLAT